MNKKPKWKKHFHIQIYIFTVTWKCKEAPSRKYGKEYGNGKLQPRKDRGNEETNIHQGKTKCAKGEKIKLNTLTNKNLRMMLGWLAGFPIGSVTQPVDEREVE